MYFPFVVISKFLNFSSQRDMKTLAEIFQCSPKLTKLICPFCLTFESMDKELFHLSDEIPWYDIRYLYDQHRASRITLDRIEYADDSFELKMRTMEEINDFKFDKCVLDLHMLRYQQRLNTLIQNPTETVTRINEILKNSEIFNTVWDFVNHIVDNHIECSRIFFSMMQSNEITSFRRDRVGYGITLEGYAGEYRSILTQTIIQGALIMVQDLVPGSTQKHQLIPTSLHKILALRNLLQCICDAIQCRIHHPNRETMEAERYYGRANALRLICDSILKLPY